MLKNTVRPDPIMRGMSACPSTDGGTAGKSQPQQTAVVIMFGIRASGSKERAGRGYRYPQRWRYAPGEASQIERPLQLVAERV